MVKTHSTKLDHIGHNRPYSITEVTGWHHPFPTMLYIIVINLKAGLGGREVNINTVPVWCPIRHGHVQHVLSCTTGKWRDANLSFIHCYIPVLDCTTK